MPNIERQIAEAVAICELCRSIDAEVRIFGGVAVAIVGDRWFVGHPHYSRLTKDIDLVGRKEDLTRIREVLLAQGYRETRRIALETEGGRAMFSRADFIVDYSSDALVFAQRLPLRNRLSCSFPTLSITDLVLEKLQIVSPQLRHLTDFIALVCSQDGDFIETDYFWSVLGRLWPYWHSALLFLAQVRTYCRREGFTEALPVVEAVERTVLSAPHTWQWKLRSGFGSLLPWYAPVEPQQDDY